MKIFHGLFIFLMLAAISCSEGPKSESNKIDPSLVIDKNQRQGRKYALDSSGSFINWSGSNGQISHYGIFHIDHGYITIKDSAVSGGEIFINLSDFRILDMKDNPVESRRLATFMKSAEFFDIQSFPQAKFVIDSVRPIVIPVEIRVRMSKNAYELPTDSIYGTLSIKGLKRNIRFPAKIDMRYFSLQGSADFMIDRNNWNLNPPPLNSRMESDGQLPDSIEVGFDIIANAH